MHVAPLLQNKYMTANAGPTHLASREPSVRRSVIVKLSFSLAS